MLDTNSIYSNIVMLAIAHNRFYRPVEDDSKPLLLRLWLHTFYIVLYSYYIGTYVSRSYVGFEVS